MSDPNTLYGVDISTTISAASAACFVKNGYGNIVIPRGYQSNGVVDTKVCTSIINAYNAKVKTRDTYLFPCPKCSKSAAAQVNELVTYLNAHCKT